MMKVNNEEYCIMEDNPPYWRNFRFEGSERHEAFFGIKNRRRSIEDGLVVFLTPEWHRGTNGVHGKNGKFIDDMIKKNAEMVWLRKYNKTIEDFIKEYGKNYL